VVRLNLDIVFRKSDRHVRVSGKKLVHHAFEIRREVLNHDKSHAGIRRQIRKKLFKGFKAAGRCANADDA
jgi:hypothetical protein